MRTYPRLCQVVMVRTEHFLVHLEGAAGLQCAHHVEVGFTDARAAADGGALLTADVAHLRQHQRTHYTLTTAGCS